MFGTLDHLMSKADALPHGARYILGIVGFPGSGKSTLAAALVERVNQRRPALAAAVPMDGFHLSNSQLEAEGNRGLKGVPETFDADGLIALMEELRHIPARRVSCPAFERTLDEPTPDKILIEPHHRLLIIEGNYLLLKQAPWHRAVELLDECWYIDATTDEILPRLMERHMAGGKTQEEARRKVESTDLPNARLIEQTRKFADCIISQADVSALLAQPVT
ncbi:MAG TPA: nucleoside/nucleotide kinase family protein [Candidatus Obscuribacterales bacterium]